MDTLRLTDGVVQTHNPPSHDRTHKTPVTGTKWFGDPFAPEPISVRYGCDAFLNRPFMSTGIIAQYTDEGFAIAADSLRKDFSTDSVISERVQKIFRIEESENRRVLAYALSGVTEWCNENGTVVFDWAKEFKKAVAELSAKRIDSIASYVQRVGELVIAQISQVKEGRLVDTYPDLGNGLMARALFVGYYHDVGRLVQLDFNHKNQVLSVPNITKLLTGPPEPEIFSGSKFIRDKLWHRKDRKFAKYRTPSIRASQHGKYVSPDTLTEAKDIVVNYIQACIDNQKRERECSKIGGEVHAATITPDGRFQWYRKPDFIDDEVKT